jgi:hypothetical protein
MGRLYEQIDGLLAAFIEKQPVFFVATAPVSAEGLVNCSPKSNRQELKVVAPDRLAYLEQTGSGIETVAHLRENGRIVVMVCAFEGPPRIVRIHGKGTAHPVDSPGFARLTGAFAGSAAVGVRSIVEVDIARVSDSCGYGVPLMAFQAHREKMEQWADRKGPDGILSYQAEKNRSSIDGLPGLPSLSH